jgi:hypothetical protein
MMISDGKILPVTEIGVDSLELLGYLSGVQAYRGPSEAPLSGGLFFCALPASCVVVGLLVSFPSLSADARSGLGKSWPRPRLL